MRRSANILVFLVQVFSCAVVLLGFYMMLVILDNDEWDLISEVGMLVVQPLIGAALIGLTIAACLLVGLPIRLSATIREWWKRKPLIPIAGGIVGIVCVLFAFRAGLMEQVEVIRDGEPKIKMIPNEMLVITGWFLIAFSLLHFYPQFIVRYVVRRFAGRISVE